MYHTLIFGHSICRRLQEHISRGTDSRLSPDLRLARKSKISIVGRGGLTLQQLMADGGRLLDSLVDNTLTFDVIFLQLGGNDFAPNERVPEDFSLQLLALAALLHGRYKVRRIVVGYILPRFSCRGREDPVFVQRYSAWAQTVNAGLRHHSRDLAYVSVWDHNNTFTFPSASHKGGRRFFSRDGVHLSNQGQYRLYKSIRGALMNAFHSLA